MAGILSGLESLGLGALNGADVLADEEEKKKAAAARAAAVEPPKVQEKDLIYDKAYTCKVCHKSFNAKVMKSGKSKLLGVSFALRPRYEGIAAEKYDVLLCPHCGYAALTKYFDVLLDAQAKLIKENISKNVILTEYKDETYGFEQALERYKLALANAVVKKGKISERSFICLKTAWLLSSYCESLQEEEGQEEKIRSLKAQEEEYFHTAMDGFVDARQKETPPIAGMDGVTLDYLIAELAVHFKEYDLASRMIQSILTATGANARIKDKARDLKDTMQAQKKA
ncbi:MAG: DUF2225 domain-containing protein [Lachnospiraceae bacterium]|nr:DUF2225 domain-containing protein [Lachnospiraceae bacterium]